MTQKPKCPGCSCRLRASAQVVSDGSEYLFYLCPQCEDIVTQQPDGSWVLTKTQNAHVSDVVSLLQQMAVECWRVRSTSRSPLSSSLHKERLSG